jgi:hypothetical protein
VSHDLQQLVVHAVTHGGLPANAGLAILANPVVAAEALTNPGILGKILDAAEASFGNALHVGLTVSAGMAGWVEFTLLRAALRRLSRLAFIVGSLMLSISFCQVLMCSSCSSCSVLA